MQPVDPEATPATARLLASLREVGASNAFLFGHQNTAFSSQSAQNRYVTSDVVTATGQYPAVVGFNLAQIKNRALRVALDEAKRHGAVLTASWEAVNPVTGGSAHDVEGNPVASILAGGPAAAQWHKMLDEVATFLRDLEVPVLFRPFHENTGTNYGYWWAESCAARDFQQLWASTQQYLWQRGVHNLLFVYSPAKPDRDYKGAFIYRYPGASQVDVIAFDYYGEHDISRGLASCCKITAEFAHREGKPVAIAEFGWQGGFASKGPQIQVSPSWFTDSFLHPVLNTPECRSISYALTWTNAGPAKYYIPLPHQASFPGFMELFRSDEAIFANRLARVGITKELLSSKASAGRSRDPPLARLPPPPSLRPPVHAAAKSQPPPPRPPHPQPHPRPHPLPTATHGTALSPPPPIAHLPPPHARPHAAVWPPPSVGAKPSPSPPDASLSQSMPSLSTPPPPPPPWPPVVVHKLGSLSEAVETRPPLVTPADAVRSSAVGDEAIPLLWTAAATATLLLAVGMMVRAGRQLLSAQRRRQRHYSPVVANGSGRRRHSQKPQRT